MLSTLSTLERKWVGVSVREWAISYNVEILYDEDSVDNDIISEEICSLEHLKCADFLILQKVSSR